MITKIRQYGRKWVSTPNTLRYLLEWERIEKAIDEIGKIGVIMDAGAGSGEYSRRMLESGYVTTVVAVEPFKENFELLDKNLASFTSKAKCVQGTLEELPLMDSSVDCVICSQVLEHIEDHERVVDEFSRVLRPGGHAIITVPRPPEPFPQSDHVREGYIESELEELFCPRGFKPLYWDWFLTKTTLARFVKSMKLPGKGFYLPIQRFDDELSLSPKERQDDQPYGLLCVFKKNATKGSE